MTDTKMYVVTMTSGSYDENRITSIVGVTTDQAKGQQYVDSMNKKFMEMAHKVKPFDEDILPKWYKANPYPNPPTGVSHTKKKKDKTLTKDPVYETALVSYKEAVTRWNDSLCTFSQEWLNQKLTDEELTLYKRRDNNHWSIEEATWL